MQTKDLQTDAVGVTRQFIAIPVPDDVRATLAAWRDETASVRWTRPDTYHLTLRFLGTRTRAEVDAVVAGCRRLRWEPFSLQIGGVGGFPDHRSPRVLWAGAMGEAGALWTLQASVEAVVQDAGVEPDERSYRPHVTLGRARKRSGIAVDAWFGAHEDAVSRAFEVGRFHLYESRCRGGVHHVVLATFTAG